MECAERIVDLGHGPTRLARLLMLVAGVGSDGTGGSLLCVCRGGGPLGSRPLIKWALLGFALRVRGHWRFRLFPRARAERSSPENRRRRRNIDVPPGWSRRVVEDGADHCRMARRSYFVIRVHFHLHTLANKFIICDRLRFAPGSLRRGLLGSCEQYSWLDRRTSKGTNMRRGIIK